MSVALSVAALALIGLAPLPSSPAPRAQRLAVPAACVSPERTGTFRVFATKPDGSQALPAMLILENIEGCLEATFVTENRGPAIIDHLSVAGDTLEGSLNVIGNRAHVTFRFDGSTVAGTIVDRREEWRVQGKRTS